MEHNKLSPELIDELKRKGFTQSQIAKMFGVSPQAVSKMKKSRDGYYRTPREIVMERFPWTPGGEFWRAYPFQQMEIHAEFMAQGDKKLSLHRVNKLNGFYNKIENENVVLEFDPDIPAPGPGRIGGFAFRAREDSDGELLFRVNEYVRPEALDVQGRILWRLPEVRPQYRGNDK